MRKLFLLALGAWICASSFAQKEIRGRIVNDKNVPLSSSLVTEVFSDMLFMGNIVQADSLGRFKITQKKNESFLYVTHLGYKPKKVILTSDTLSYLPIIMDVDSAFTLQEVNITAQKQAVTIKKDRIAYDMSINPLQESDAFQSLRFVPLVAADDKKFSIIGKEITQVYINNRKVNMDQAALYAYLKTLPASRIETVEVITHPGSAFRGEGDFGIINIKLKKNENEGLSGFANVAAWKTHHFKEEGNINLDYHHNRFSSNISAGIANRSTWKKSETENLYLTENLTTRQHSTYDMRQRELFLDWQADYQLNKQHTFGWIVNTFLENDHGNEGGATSFWRNVASTADSLIDTRRKHKVRERSLAVNTNYRYEAENGKKYIWLDFDYLYNFDKQFSRDVMNHLDNDGNMVASYLNMEQEVPQRANVVSGKAEYGREYENQFDFQVGFDSYYSNIKNDNEYRVWINNVYTKDPLRSDLFEVKEWTSALFLQTHKAWRNTFSTSLGARVEYTKYTGTQHTLQEDFVNDYFKVLPTFSVQYAPHHSHSIYYSLSYRISRPNFASLNPFITYTSPTVYYTGNPFLKPTGYWNQYIRYGLFSKYFFTFSYDRTKDAVNPIQRLKENNVIENSMINMGTIDALKIGFSTNFRYLSGRATSNVNAVYEWKQVKGNSESGSLDYTHNTFRIYLQNNVMLSTKHDLSFDFGGNYYTKMRNSFLELPSGINWNAQLRKKINNFQVSVYFNAVNYLYDGKWTRVWKIDRSNDYLHSVEDTKGETLSAGLRLTYSFGNSKVKQIDKHNTSNSEVKSRVY